MTTPLEDRLREIEIRLDAFKHLPRVSAIGGAYREDVEFSITELKMARAALRAIADGNTHIPRRDYDCGFLHCVCAEKFAREFLASKPPEKEGKP